MHDIQSSTTRVVSFVVSSTCWRTPSRRSTCKRTPHAIVSSELGYNTRHPVKYNSTVSGLYNVSGLQGKGTRPYFKLNSVTACSSTQGRDATILRVWYRTMLRYGPNRIFGLYPRGRVGYIISRKRCNFTCWSPVDCVVTLQTAKVETLYLTQPVTPPLFKSNRINSWFSTPPSPINDDALRCPFSWSL